VVTAFTMRLAEEQRNYVREDRLLLATLADINK